MNDPLMLPSFPILLPAAEVPESSVGTYEKLRLDSTRPPRSVSTTTGPLPGEERGSVVTTSLAVRGKGRGRGRERKRKEKKEREREQERESSVKRTCTEKN